MKGTPDRIYRSYVVRESTAFDGYYEYYHVEYDGGYDPDEVDPRQGLATSLQDALESIDELQEEVL